VVALINGFAAFVGHNNSKIAGEGREEAGRGRERGGGGHGGVAVTLFEKSYRTLGGVL
jgi:hypothetical protein